MRNHIIAAALLASVVPSHATDVAYSRKDFLDFANLVVTMATRQGVLPTKTCDADGCETSFTTKIADDFIRVDTETYTDKGDVVVVCKGNPKDYPYRMCNDSEGRIYRQKLIDGEFRLESLSRTTWPSQ
jgi:hypothetical protein